MATGNFPKKNDTALMNPQQRQAQANTPKGTNMHDGKKGMQLGGGGRFAALKKKLASHGAKSPAALAAYIGRKSLGKKKFQKLAAAGKKRS